MAPTTILMMIAASTSTPQFHFSSYYWSISRYTDTLIILSHFATWWDVISLHLYGSLSDISLSPSSLFTHSTLYSIKPIRFRSRQRPNHGRKGKCMDGYGTWLWISPFGFFFFLCAAAGHCFCPHAPHHPSSRPISIISVAYSSLSENVSVLQIFLSVNHDSFLISKRGRWMIKLLLLLLLCVCMVWIITAGHNNGDQGWSWM